MEFDRAETCSKFWILKRSMFLVIWIMGRCDSSSSSIMVLSQDDRVRFAFAISKRVFLLNFAVSYNPFLFDWLSKSRFSFESFSKVCVMSGPSIITSESLIGWLPIMPWNCSATQSLSRRLKRSTGYPVRYTCPRFYNNSDGLLMIPIPCEIRCGVVIRPLGYW